ncbi:MAG: YlbF family regulator [Defluviitaleaceae bacterium]|nr:YlbF family regulator [Defluviitaleaceae bacterium]
MNTRCYEKAVELGNMVLASEVSLRLADAKAAFEEDMNAQTAYADYNEFCENTQIAYKSGFLTQKKYQEALQRMVEMEIDVKNIPIVQEYIKAKEDYDNFANSVIEMLRQTIGHTESKSCGCGGCGSHGKR